MAPGGNTVVYVVDDELVVRESLAFLLASAGHRVESFADARSFLARCADDDTGCLIVDLQMPEVDGLEVQRRLNERGSALPVIFITGHGDVPAAVRALKSGAVDFLEKPFDTDRLLGLIEDALVRNAHEREQRARRARVTERAESLTPREREVLALVAAGRANKVVAAELTISERTVELHRARIMRKMAARSLPELMRMIQVMES